MRAIHSLLVLSALSLVACSDDKKPAGGTDNEAPVAKAAPTDHGDKTDLGTLTVAGSEFGVFRLGDLVPGEEGAFEVHPKGVSADEAVLNV